MFRFFVWAIVSAFAIHFFGFWLGILASFFVAIAVTSRPY